MTREIRFYGQNNHYGWLSNFYPSPIVDRGGNVWPTVEHAFQAMKTLDHDERRQIRECSYPSLAKRLGRQVTLRPGWNDMREDVMRRLLSHKFTCHAELRDKLIATGDARLIEDSPTDYYWGIGADDRGHNRLGVLLTETRTTLQTHFVDGRYQPAQP